MDEPLYLKTRKQVNEELRRFREADCLVLGVTPSMPCGGAYMFVTVRWLSFYKANKYRNKEKEYMFLRDGNLARTFSDGLWNLTKSKVP